MTESKEIESLFKQFLQPFEDQINKLQQEQKEKDIEICTLKHAIYNLSKIITNLQNGNSNQTKIPQIGKQPIKKEEEKKSPATKRPNTSHPQLRPPTKKDEKSLKTPISDKHSVYSEEKQDVDTVSFDDKNKNNKKLVKKPVVISPKKKIEEVKAKDIKADKKKDTKADDAAKKKEGKFIQKEKNEKKEEKNNDQEQKNDQKQKEDQEAVDEQEEVL